MKLHDWLRPELIFPRLVAGSAKQLVARVTDPVVEHTGANATAVEAALWRGTADDGSSVGRGVAFPHADLEGIEAPIVAIALLDEPLPLKTVDGVAPDIFFCILSPPDAPHQHLLLLAHLARLVQSRTLVEGLRGADTPDEVVALLEAAEARQHPEPVAPVDDADVMVTITIAGERAVDALLIDLVDMGLDDATVIEAQNLREAVTREVPLFSGFRDLFGDPGGRRVVLVETEARNVDELITAVQTVCSDHDVQHARVTTVQLAQRWEHRTPEQEAAGGGGH